MQVITALGMSPLTRFQLTKVGTPDFAVSSLTGGLRVFVCVWGKYLHHSFYHSDKHILLWPVSFLWLFPLQFFSLSLHLSQQSISIGPLTAITHCSSRKKEKKVMLCRNVLFSPLGKGQYIHMYNVIWVSKKKKKTQKSIHIYLGINGLWGCYLVNLERELRAHWRLLTPFLKAFLSPKPWALTISLKGMGLKKAKERIFPSLRKHKYGLRRKYQRCLGKAMKEIPL